MNEIIIKIDNCLDCPHSIRKRIYTADPWEHEIGLYCTLCKEDRELIAASHNNIDRKLIVADDGELRPWSLIPDWCPLLEEK